MFGLDTCNTENTTQISNKYMYIPSPPLPVTTDMQQQHAPAAWQRLFTGGQKVLHCFSAIHSSCIKVHGSKGRRGGLSFLPSLCSVVNPCVHVKQDNMY